MNHGGVGRHAQVHLVLILHPGPCGHAAILWRKRGATREQPHLQLPSKTSLPHRLPAVGVTPSEFGDFFVGSMQCPVRRRVGQIEKHRLFRPNSFLKKLQGVVGERRRRIPVLRHGDDVVIQHKIAARQISIMMSAALRRAVKAIKSSFERPLRGLGTNVPLSCDRGEVARRFQRFGDRHAPVIESTTIRWITVVLGHMPNARLVLVKAG